MPKFCPCLLAGATSSFYLGTISSCRFEGPEFENGGARGHFGGVVDRVRGATAAFAKGREKRAMPTVSVGVMHVHA